MKILFFLTSRLLGCQSSEVWRVKKYNIVFLFLIFLQLFLKNKSIKLNAQNMNLIDNDVKLIEKK